MGRLRRLGYSIGIALMVFSYLSLPTLRQLYGPVVNIPVYAAIALLAGGVTWEILSKLSTDSSSEKTVLWINDELSASEDLPDDVEVNVGVDDEINRLREEQ